MVPCPGEPIRAGAGESSEGSMISCISAQISRNLPSPSILLRVVRLVVSLPSASVIPAANRYSCVSKAQTCSAFSLTSCSKLLNMFFLYAPLALSLGQDSLETQSAANSGGCNLRSAVLDPCSKTSSARTRSDLFTAMSFSSTSIVFCPLNVDARLAARSGR